MAYLLFHLKLFTFIIMQKDDILYFQLKAFQHKVPIQMRYISLLYNKKCYANAKGFKQ